MISFLCPTTDFLISGHNLLGKELHLPCLLHAKKFQNRGNKDGALAAFKEFEKNGFGSLTGSNRVIY